MKEKRTYEGIRFPGETIQRAAGLCFARATGFQSLYSSLELDGRTRIVYPTTDAEFFDAYRRATGNALYDRRADGLALRVSYHAERASYTNVTVDAPTTEEVCDVFNVFSATQEKMTGLG